MLKPIEPGCLAIVVIGPCAGQSVEVIAWVEPGQSFITSFGVVTNSTGISGWGVDARDRWGVFASSALRRIDDYDATADETQQEVRDDAPAHA